MVLRVTLLIFGLCFFFDQGSSYHIQKGKAHVKEYIIDGTPRSIEGAEHNVQFIVNLTDSHGDLTPAFICGGSLITNEIVLTAAHCLKILKDTKNVEVYAGSAKLYDYVEKRSWKSIVIHPYYRAYDISNKDIALIKVDKPFSSSKITPIPLAIAPPKGFEQVTVNGFGSYLKRNLTFSPILRELTGSLVNCSRPDLHIRTDICVQNPVGKGICFGDSGGGAVNSNLELTGIASRIFGECGTNKMDVYTSVYDHLIFIVAGLQRLSPDDDLAKKIIEKVYGVFTEKIGFL